MEGRKDHEVLEVAATTRVPNREQRIEPNPMLNSVVVGRLFELIPFNLSDFRNFRIVSKAWWEASLPNFRKNVRLCLKDNHEDGGSQRSSFETFVDWLNLAGDPYRLLGNYPFWYYSVQQLHFNLDGVTRASQKKAKFWAQTGPKMKQLELSLSVVYNKAHFRRLLFEFTPNLTHLSLKNNEFRDQCYDIAPPFPKQRNLVELEVVEVTPNRGGAFGTDLPRGAWFDVFVQYPNIQVFKLTKQSVVQPPQTSQLAAVQEFQEFFYSVDLFKKHCGLPCLSQLQRMVLNNYLITGDELSVEDSEDMFHFIMHNFCYEFLFLPLLG